MSGTTTVTIRDDSSGAPTGSAIATWTASSWTVGLNEFDAPANTHVDPDTVYWIVAEHSPRDEGPRWYRVLLREGVDSGSATGWRISQPYEISDGGPWSVQSSTRAMKIQVRGTAVLPEITIASDGDVTEGEDASFTLTRTEDTAAELAVEVTVAETGDMVSSSDEETRTVTFAAGSATAVLTVPTQDDNTDEPDSTVSVAVVDGGLHDLGTPSTAMVTVADNDLPVVTVASDGDVAEGEDASFTLTRVGITTAELAVEVTVSETGDVVSSSHEGTRTVTFGAGSDTATLTVTTQDDGVSEPDSTVSVAVTDGADYRLGTPSTAGTVVADNDRPPVTVASGDDVTEGEDARFTLTRTGDTAAELAIEVAVSETGDAVAPGDEGTRTVTFDAGSATATLTVPTRDDDADEPDSTVGVAVADGADYRPGTPSTAEVTVADNDLPVVTVASDGDVSEGEDASFTLTRMGVATAELAVDVTVSETEDMVVPDAEGTRTVTFDAGSATATLTAPTQDDGVDEPDSTVSVAVTDGADYRLGTPSAAEATVADNDEPAPSAVPVVTVAAGGDVTEGEDVRFTLTRTGDTAAELTVEVSVWETGDKVAPGDKGLTTVTFDAGASAATLTVPTQDDNADEPDSTVSVAVADGDAWDTGMPSVAEAAVADNDEPAPSAVPVVTVAAGGDVTEGADARFALTRTGDTTAELAVEVAVSETGDMVASDDEGTRTVTFGAGASTATLTVPTRDDGADEPDSTVSVTVADGDAWDPGTPSAAEVAVADNDEPAIPVVTVAAGDDVTEGADALFTLTRTGDAAAGLTVEVAVSETGDMVAPDDEGARTVTFGAGSATAALTVPTRDDGADEPDSTVSVTVEDGDAWDPGTPSAAGVTVADNDEPVPASVVDKRTKALTNGLSGIARAVTATTVNRIWDRAARLEPGGVRTSATLGGRVVDAGAFARNGDAQRMSGAVAGLLGVDGVVPRGAPAGASDVRGPGAVAGGHGDAALALLPDERDLMGRTRFELGLGGSSGGVGSFALWGRGDVTAFESRHEDDALSDFSTDGEVISGHVGLDYLASPDFLAGVAVGHSRGEVAYAFAASGDGPDEVETELTSVHPYLYWMPSDGLHVWGTMGYGAGTATVTEGAAQAETDIALRTVGAGVRTEVARIDEVDIAVKADAFVAEVVAEAVTVGLVLDEAEAESSRVRAAVEGTHAWTLEGGDRLSGTLELGARVDAGDAESGAGADVAGALRYAGLRNGLAVALRGSTLLAHEHSGFEAWGVGLLANWDPGVAGEGLQLAVSPAWNAPRSDVAEAMWNAEAGSPGRGAGSSQRGAAVDVRLGYGMRALHDLALMTVFTEAGGDSDARHLRLGTELRPAGAGVFAFRIHGERLDRRDGPEHALWMNLGIAF